jgi:hypothetical protein
MFTTEDCHRVQTPSTPGWRADAGLELPSVVHKPAEKRHDGHGDTHADTVLAQEVKEG